MSTTPESAVLLVGLSGTGKTNFLVGLDVILDEQADPEGLVHSGFAPDRAYLQPLREMWLRGEELPHTSRQFPPLPHQLLVVHRTTGKQIVFFVPDLAGETFDGHFVTRSLPIDIANRFTKAQGIVLFVHFDHESDHAVHENPTFRDPNEKATAVEGASPHSHGAEWRIEDAAKQVKIVDLLQFVSKLGKRETPLRIAVAISAWDRADSVPAGLENEMPKEPSRFFDKRWPLLSQFLNGNASDFRFRVFGVSARGGGNSPADIARLTGFLNPRDRISLVDGATRSSDLTKPIRWLLGLLD
jgi:hypothetical protein